MKVYTINNPGGCTVTIFAPYDCENNCEFCVNKKDYKKYKPDFDKVLESIKIMHNITPCCDFVITGGEPFADIDKLCDMLDLIEHLDTIMSHKIYINTTLPTSINDQNLINFNNKYRTLIDCINVSRNQYIWGREYYNHDLPNDAQSSEEVINQLEIPVRINCTLSNMRDCRYLVGQMSKYFKYPNVKEIQFREDYRGGDESHLSWCSPMFLRTVEEVNTIIYTPLKYYGINLEQFKREQIRWTYGIGMVCINSSIDTILTYHKTLPYSNIGGCLNDIIIRQDGVILDDWNDYGHELDLFEYQKVYEDNK